MQCGWRYDRVNAKLDVSWLRMLLSALAMLVLFEFTPLDFRLADIYFQSGRFVGAGNWWLDVFSHKWVKWAIGMVAIAVWLTVLASRFVRRWPIDRRRWVAVGLAMLLGPATVGVLKHFSSTHCPWDLQRYGGESTYVKLQDFKPTTSEPGRCFPAGHATTGYALFGFVLLWRKRKPRLASLAWWLALTTGFVLGWGQQMRGAHFLSHTLWSAWVCWAVCLILFSLLFRADVAKTESSVGG